ncbi:hypothetical protein ACFXP3_26795 [Streptomyces sp. NPDC059096]|uniref:hypothetical protein n=1 Tax=Streptomyces sp. NPDC059096 TaxID=3346727 RepID=UPI0036B61275
MDASAPDASRAPVPGASVPVPVAGVPGAGRPDEDGTGAADPGAGAPPPYDSSRLAALVARLRGAGLDPDAEQLCDALWLAQQTRRDRGGPRG